MKLTKSKLKEMIREELLNEGGKILTSGKDLPKFDKLAGATIKSVKRLDKREVLFVFDNGRKMILDIYWPAGDEEGANLSLDIEIK